MRLAIIRIAIVCMGLTLAACQNDPPPPPEQNTADGAKGEVLEGTIDDSMLPIDISAPPSEAATGDDSSGEEEEAAD